MRWIIATLTVLLLATSASAFRTTLTHTAATVGTSSAEALAANNSRNYLLLQNDDGTNDIYCKFGAAAVLNEGIRIEAANAQKHEWDYKTPTGALNCIAAAGTPVLLISEGAQ